MDSLKHRAIIFLISISLVVMSIDARKEVCIETICGRRNGYLSIRFPFRVTNVQPETCGYPGFDLYCDALNKTLLYFPNAGNFTVQGIDYRTQEILLDDPGDCLPKKLLSGLDLSHSPFRFKDYYYDLSLYECPVENENFSSSVYLHQEIFSCLSTTPNHVVIGAAGYFDASSLEPWCDLIGNLTAPGSSLYKISRLRANMLLAWDEPKCGLCEGNVTQCRFKHNDGNLETICMDYDPLIAPGQQLSKKARYAIGISLGVGLPVIVIFVVVLVEVIRYRRRSREDHNRGTSVEMAPRG